MGLSRRQFTKEFKLTAVLRLEAGVSLAEVARGLVVKFFVTTGSNHGRKVYPNLAAGIANRPHSESDPGKRPSPSKNPQHRHPPKSPKAGS